jgi:hypothetical protein
MIFRKIAGVILIACGTGLAAISGVLAYAGFESQIQIPFAGWIGPFTAAAGVALGIAVESEIRHRRWVAAAVLGVLLVIAGGLDRHSGELALMNEVEKADQTFSDRDSSYKTAVGSKAAAEKQITDLDAELLLMVAEDEATIKKAQLRLSSLGYYKNKIDGDRGGDTLDAMNKRGDEIRGLLVTARDDLKKATDTVAAGAPTAELPFNLTDAALYATLITVLSIVLAFAGSYVFAGFNREEGIDEVMDEVEDAVSGVEAEIFDLVSFMDEQKTSRKRR